MKKSSSSEKHKFNTKMFGSHSGCLFNFQQLEIVCVFNKINLNKMMRCSYLGSKNPVFRKTQIELM